MTESLYATGSFVMEEVKHQKKPLPERKNVFFFSNNIFLFADNT